MFFYLLWQSYVKLHSLALVAEPAAKEEHVCNFIFEPTHWNLKKHPSAPLSTPADRPRQCRLLIPPCRTFQKRFSSSLSQHRFDSTHLPPPSVRHWVSFRYIDFASQLPMACQSKRRWRGYWKQSRHVDRAPETQHQRPQCSLHQASRSLDDSRRCIWKHQSAKSGSAELVTGNLV